jgi:hypothetical protein
MDLSMKLMPQKRTTNGISSHCLSTIGNFGLKEKENSINYDVHLAYEGLGQLFGIQNLAS